jgi:hypothetical protein
MQESAKSVEKSESAGEKLAFFTLDLTGKSLNERLWCQAPFRPARFGLVFPVKAD